MPGQVPWLAVRLCPTLAVPLMDGSTIGVGAGPAVTSVALLVLVPAPYPALVPVALTVMLLPTSACASV